jgi:hypothetical protein
MANCLDCWAIEQELCLRYCHCLESSIRRAEETETEENNQQIVTVLLRFPWMYRHYTRFVLSNHLCHLLHQSQNAIAEGVHHLALDVVERSVVQGIHQCQ